MPLLIVLWSKTYVRDSDRNGIILGSGNDHIVSNCVVESADLFGVDSTVARYIFSDSNINSTGNDGFYGAEDEGIIANSVVTGAGDSGIQLQENNDTVVIGNLFIIHQKEESSQIIQLI